MRPSRKPFCRQCFSWYFEAHFHPFHTFPFIFSLFAQKAILSAKSGFGRKKAIFCILGHLFGSFRHPCANLALDNGFFGVLRSLFPSPHHLGLILLFSRQNAFLAPKQFLEPKKTVSGAKSAFWREKTENGLQKRKKWKNGAQNTKETIV